MYELGKIQPAYSIHILTPFRTGSGYLLTWQHKGADACVAPPHRPVRLRHTGLSGYATQVAQMAPDGPGWPQMVPDGPRWPQMAQMAQMASDGPRWPQMAPDGPRWLQMAQMAPDGPRWPRWLQME